MMSLDESFVQKAKHTGRLASGKASVIRKKNL
jgi:hypothetical protein